MVPRQDIVQIIAITFLLNYKYIYICHGVHFGVDGPMYAYV